jgi:hypothetical protein
MMIMYSIKKMNEANARANNANKSAGGVRRLGSNMGFSSPTTHGAASPNPFSSYQDNSNNNANNNAMPNLTFDSTGDGAAINTGLTNIPWADLCKVLSIEGEPLSYNDLYACLTALMGEANAQALLNTAQNGQAGPANAATAYKPNANVTMNSGGFVDVLGFEAT